MNELTQFTGILALFAACAASTYLVRAVHAAHDRMKAKVDAVSRWAQYEEERTKQLIERLDAERDKRNKQS